MKEKVILVNEKDEQIGLMEKIEAHEKALLHRAFSVFVYNDKNEVMLQQRALSKYHSPGLWTNTCCSHQREGESNIDAGNPENFGFREMFRLPSLYKADCHSRKVQRCLAKNNCPIENNLA